MQDVKGLKVLPREGVTDEEFYLLTLCYWEQDGVDEKGKILWQYNSLKITREVLGRDLKPVHLAAAIAGYAVKEGYMCSVCGAEAQFRSRTEFEEALKGKRKEATSCGACESNYYKALSRIITRETGLIRKEGQNLNIQPKAPVAECEISLKDEDIIKEWKKSAKRSLEKLNERNDSSPSWDELDSETFLNILAWIKVDSDGVTKFGELYHAMSPLRNELSETARKICNSRILLIDFVASTKEAFVFTPSLEESLAESRFFTSKMIVERYLPEKIVFRVPAFMDNLEINVSKLKDDLECMISDEAIIFKQDKVVLEKAEKVLIAEASLIFEEELARHGLPGFTSKQIGKLESILGRMVKELSLSQIYSLIWQARQNALTYSANKTYYATKEKAVSHAINRFEAIYEEKSQGEISSFNLPAWYEGSALLYVIFSDLFGLPPKSSAISDLRLAIEREREKLQELVADVDVDVDAATSDLKATNITAAIEIMRVFSEAIEHLSAGKIVEILNSSSSIGYANGSVNGVYEETSGLWLKFMRSINENASISNIIGEIGRILEEVHNDPWLTVSGTPFWRELVDELTNVAAWHNQS